MTGAVAIVLTTFASREVAAPIARTLVEEHLAACVNLVDRIASIYRWDGRVCEESETLALIKTAPDRADALIARLRALHPYTTPELVRLDGAAADPYLAWVLNETRAI